MGYLYLLKCDISDKKNSNVNLIMRNHQTKTNLGTFYKTTGLFSKTSRLKKTEIVPD